MQDSAVTVSQRLGLPDRKSVQDSVSNVKTQLSRYCVNCRTVNGLTVKFTKLLQTIKV